MVSLKNEQVEIGTLIQLTPIGNIGFEESSHGLKTLNACIYYGKDQIAAYF